MGEKICEAIPFKNFRERIRLTKEYLKRGITPQLLDNHLLIDYSTDVYFGMIET
jgi:hypothetical protein